jgi:hypothetical protein
MSSTLRIGCACIALFPLFIAVVFLGGTGPHLFDEESRPSLLYGGIALVLGVAGMRLALRGAGRLAVVSVAAMAAFALGPCTVFFLGYNGLAPFQISDVSGTQWEIQRGVPGDVRYTTGYGVAVLPPQIDRYVSSGGDVWIIPLRFSNNRDADFVHVGRCALREDGHERDPHRERPEIRRLGDVESEVVSFPAGGSYEGRVAFEVPRSAKRVRLACVAHGYVTATFDLSGFVSRT